MKGKRSINIVVAYMLAFLVCIRTVKYRELADNTNDLFKAMWLDLRISTSGISLTELIHVMLWQLLIMLPSGTYFYDNIYLNITLIFPRTGSGVLKCFIGKLILRTFLICAVCAMFVFFSGVLCGIDFLCNTDTLVCLARYVLFCEFLCIAANLLSFFIDAKYSIVIVCAFNVICIYVLAAIPSFMNFLPVSLILYGFALDGYTINAIFTFIYNIILCALITVLGNWAIRRKEYYN